MSEGVLPVAVIGLGAFGRRTLEALAECSCARLAGVADRDARRAEEAGREFNVPFYTDNRQLLLSARPKAVFLATPPMHAPDLLEACLEMEMHVWKEAPLGRNLSEAAAFVRRFEERKLLLAVGTQRRFAETYRLAHRRRDRVGEVFLARAEYLFNWGAELRWRGDKQSAGGGALLELGCHPIDLLIWMLGLPEQVYGVIARENSPNGENPRPPHDTDDTVSALLRYGGNRTANVVASRVSGPVREELALHGRDGSITANGDTCVIRNSDGDVLDHLRDDSPPDVVFRRQAEAFLDAVQADTPNGRYACSAAENLLTHAVIDAIYLSHRTGQPERPADQLRMNGFEPADCLKHSLTVE
ncbi:MAG: Gfo/Idh/MocA family oxidoreductase [Phycisphaerae bacterium]|nr:Gfo/Idh/MocA family oxidoreductase [Phycisphaerae bacterium]